MKKISVILLLVALFAGFSAQAKFSIGPKLGVNIDKMHISGDNLKSGNRCGFTGGVEAEYVAPVLGLGVDVSLMYTRMNTTVKTPFGEEKAGSNFFEIPLHLKYKLGIPAVASIIKPYVFTGPTVAFKLGNAGYSETRSTQWGWDLGLGVELIRHLQIGAGYTFGINKFMKYNDNVTVANDIKVRNNYWTVTAAWLF